VIGCSVALVKLLWEARLSFELEAGSSILAWLLSRWPTFRSVELPSLGEPNLLLPAGLVLPLSFLRRPRLRGLVFLPLLLLPSSTFFGPPPPPWSFASPVAEAHSDSLGWTEPAGEDDREDEEDFAGSSIELWRLDFVDSVLSCFSWIVKHGCTTISGNPV